LKEDGCLDNQRRAAQLTIKDDFRMLKHQTKEIIINCYFVLLLRTP
jgi:hypothetical protein